MAIIYPRVQFSLVKVKFCSDMRVEGRHTALANSVCVGGWGVINKENTRFL